MNKEIIDYSPDTKNESVAKASARIAIQPVFEGISYTGTEGAKDMPLAVVVPDNDFVNRPA